MAQPTNPLPVARAASHATEQAVGHAWLWRNTEMSDSMLHLVVDNPGGSSDCARTASEGPEVQAQTECIPAHTLVLAAASPGYWRRRVLAWSSLQPDAPEGVPVLEEYCTSAELPDCLAVLEYAYTGQLAPDAGIALLCQMIAKADYWDMPACLAACKRQIISLSSPTMAFDDAISLINLLVERLLNESNGIHLKDGAIAALISAFGSVRTIIVTDSLKEQFCSLPFHLLTIWAGLDQLTVDSENSVAVLLTVWYNHQVAMGTTPSEDQCKQLSDLVRLVHLSPSFLLQVLEHLPWWRLPDGVKPGFATFAVLWQLKDCPEKGSPPLNTQQGTSRARQADSRLSLLEWQVSLAQLQRAFDRGGHVLSRRLYCAGWEWQCTLEWRDKKDVPGSKTLGMFMYVHPPKCVSFKDTQGVAATAKVTMWSHTSSRVLDSVFRSGTGRGFSDILHSSVSDVKAGLANIMKAEKLHLEISVSKAQ